jgi:hypothetical protein
MNEQHLIELRDKAMYAASSSARTPASDIWRRQDIAAYIRAMRNAGAQYKPRLFHDMATIKHGFGVLKTSYRKLMNRAHPGGYWA